MIPLLSTLVDVYIANANTLCHEENGLLIDNREKCKQSVSQIINQEPRATFGGKVSEADWPRGCYFKFYKKFVYFNQHSVGNRNPLARPLCTAFSGTQNKTTRGITISIYTKIQEYTVS